MAYRWLLFDADGTLFDYDRAEAAALAAVWRSRGLTPGPELLETYRRVNGELWRQYERGEVAQERVPRLRFERLLEAREIAADPGELSDDYLVELGRQTWLLDGALEVLEELEGRRELALITNGLADVQRPRLARSPLGRFFSVVVISGEIGRAKPDPAFFAEAFTRMGDPPRESALVVGDSLTSDIAGGRGYGVDTCWLNRDGASAPDEVAPTFEIQRLSELLDLA